MQKGCGRFGLMVIGLMAAGVAESRELKLEIQDYTGRGFPPDLVQYNLKADRRLGPKLRLYDAQGQAVPMQLSTAAEKEHVTLSFVARVPANGAQVVTLRDDGQGAAPAGGLSAKTQGKTIELSHALLAVRLPGERDESFSKPVSAATLPAPILAFRSGSGPWVGAGRILSTNLVKTLTIKLVETGPAYAELWYELHYAGGGYYRATIQVIDQAPLVKVREEYDLGRLDGTQFWELDLSSGWKPDRAQTAAHNGNGGGDPTGRDVDFAGLMGGQPVQYLVGDQAWGKLGHLGIYSLAESKATSNACPRRAEV